MIKAGDNERFYKDVEGLGLKFPVAAIAKATGYSKGNVSQYLSKKLPPSESFLNAFYDAFKESIKKVSHEIIVSPHHGTPKTGDKVVEDLAASSRIHAEASLLREKNYQKMLSHITENDYEEIPEAIESRFSDLLELIAQLGIPTRWKDEKAAALELGKLWHGKKKVSSHRAGIRDGSGK